MNRTLFRDPALDVPMAPPSQSATGASSHYLSQVHSQAVLCSHLARLLHHALTDLDWPFLRFSDRSRLERSLTRLGSDIPLVWLIAGQPQKGQAEHKRQAAGPADVPDAGKI